MPDDRRHPTGPAAPRRFLIAGKIVTLGEGELRAASPRRTLTPGPARPIFSPKRRETDMKLSIPAMSCGHCKATVEKTIIDLDSSADVTVDLAARTAEVKTTAASGAILNALAAQGYPATVRN